MVSLSPGTAATRAGFGLGVLSPTLQPLTQPRRRWNKLRSNWDGRAPGEPQDTMEMVIGDHIAELLP